MEPAVVDPARAGQSAGVVDVLHRTSPRLMLAACMWLVPLCLGPPSLTGQVPTVGPGAAEELPLDRDDVRRSARSAQAAFERVRLRYSPADFGSGGGPCDEYVGRFCTRYDEGEWYPREEDARIIGARDELLRTLDSLQHLSPEDHWILGQRVWYRAESGAWHAALETARACGGVAAWWCHALEGLAYHGLGRYPAALAAFEAALERMDPEEARAWRIPRRAVDRRVRGMLSEWEDEGKGALDAGLAGLWALADPLFLVEGNDRLTAHYARWTVATVKRDARNPYGLSWAEDLEELTVRHGWELGYHLTRRTIGAMSGAATGHKHPEGRDFMPPGRGLEDPLGLESDTWVADARAPRSLYAPEYAPLMLPIRPQLAVFPRGEHAVVVASAYLPRDTTVHADHDHPRPWLEPGDQAETPPAMGLFALPVGAPAPLAGRTAEGPEGAVLLELPVGQYLVSAESWSPAKRRAGRYRTGLDVRAVTPDVATLSDLLLLRGGSSVPTGLEEALPDVLPNARIHPDSPLAVAWELSGLGFREEGLEYALSVERTDRGVLRRLGDFLGVSERPRPLVLSWQEPAPEVPTYQFRHVDLDLPVLDPGRYEITLRLRSRGRSEVVATLTFEVVEGLDVQDDAGPRGAR